VGVLQEPHHVLEHLRLHEGQVLLEDGQLVVGVGEVEEICGISREWMYSGISKVEASSFMVAQMRKSGCAFTFTPATMDST
jgi:ABC-type molybdate transport system ATPase subunit